MEQKEFIEHFKELMLLNGIDNIDVRAIYSLFEIKNCLVEANKIHNLTAIKDERVIMLKHFIDSLMISPYVPQGAYVADVGCGAGFPSLPLAAARPDVTIVGIDSTGKKINYVNETAKALMLTNMSAISARAEDLAHDEEYREQFDVITARAVATLPVLCELCLPYLKAGGIFIAMKAQNAEAEITASLRAIEKCGGEYYKTVYKTLKSDTSEEEKRSLIIIKKVKKSPDIYPRVYSKITKKPL